MTSKGVQECESRSWIEKQNREFRTRRTRMLARMLPRMLTRILTKEEDRQGKWERKQPWPYPRWRPRMMMAFFIICTHTLSLTTVMKRTVIILEMIIGVVFFATKFGENRRLPYYHWDHFTIWCYHLIRVTPLSLIIRLEEETRRKGRKIKDTVSSSSSK